MMEAEDLAKVEALDGKIRLVLRSDGKPSYQYVYRAGRGVYWDNDLCAFSFDAGEEMAVEKAIRHVIAVLREELNLDVRFRENVTWINVPIEARKALSSIPI